ncbi:hypothetical protein LAZ67_15001230 [Cordylochernes scorpioides]|uniref:Integrase catalytic domain-containing protein n=1 Tax=Cordylochernes scorpioides TaxID=51811 RepID=A0ABY6L8K6_9ARAC|nr:hypothetical protein LAZ67_15001230 [Cordylochernes scorpioides]
MNAELIGEDYITCVLPNESPKQILVKNFLYVPGMKENLLSVNRYTTLFLLKNKNEVFNKLKDYSAFVQNKFKTKIKTLRSDNGGEYQSTSMQEFLSICHQTSTPYCPQQNGVAERKNRSLVEMAKTMLNESGLDFKYWGEAILTANYLQNRLPTRKLTKTPYELWNSITPNLNHLRIFGSKAYVYNTRRINKFEQNALEGIFVGYSQRSKAYRILFPQTNKITISRNVVFIENFDRNSVKDINEDFNIVDLNLFNKPQIEKTNDHHNELENLPLDEKKEWLKASEEEMKSLIENDTWTLTDLAPGKKAIGCKWIFEAKYNQDGNGEDYNETFAPVSKLTTLRTMFSIAASKKLIIRQYEIKTAFLYGELMEEIYMDQPEGYIHIGKENLQDPGSRKINEILRTLEFSQAKSAKPCLYTNRQFGEMIYLLIYVDDFLIFSTSNDYINEVKSKLSEHIQLKDLGDATQYLGIQIEKDMDGNILLHQKLKILRILDKYGMSSYKGVSTYMEDDISSAIGILSRRVVKPNEHDWKALKRILGYLKSTLDLVLVFETSSSVELTGYIDADWGNKKDRKSTTGYIYKLGTNLITWVSQKQNLVSLSSAEAEYPLKKQFGLDLLMSDFGFEIKKPIILNEDNQSCIKLLNSEKVTARTKHIDIKFHFIKDLISNNCLSLNYCPTEKMLADILTKPLPKNKFQELRQGIGLITYSN